MTASTVVTGVGTPPGAKRAAYPISSVDNALALLRLIGQRQMVRLTEVSKALDIAPSTAHRLLAMLTMYGFVERDPDTRSYVAGPAFSDLTVGDEQSADLLLRGQAILAQLTARIGETSNLCVLRGISVLFLASEEVDRSPRIGSRQGVRMPAHCTSAGKALLAQMPIEVVATMYGDRPLVALAASSIAGFDRLEAELAVVRKRGWATNLGESESDVRAVAAAGPVSDHGPSAAISVAGHASRMTPQRIREIIPIVRRAAALLAPPASG